MIQDYRVQPDSVNYEEESNNEFEEDIEEEIDERQIFKQMEDPRDQIILENQKKIQRMQRNFRQTTNELREQLDAFREESTKLQYALLDRILQLKDAIKEKNEFRERLLRTRAPLYTADKNTKKKKKNVRKKRRY